MRIDDATIERIVVAGICAPSLHNTQPWLVEVAGPRITVRADPTRLLPHADPRGREMLISCGAFVLNARVAAEHEGFDAYARLLPDRHDPLLVAHITLSPLVAKPDFDEPGLYDAIMTRRSARGSVDERPLDLGAVTALHHAVARENADVTFLGPRDPTRGRLVTAMRRAEAFVERDRLLQDEDRAWLGTLRGRDDGVPRDAMGAWFKDPILDVHPPVRDEVSGARTFEGRATTAILTTVGDGPYSSVVAGQALERMLLVAASRDIHASFASRVLENPVTRDEVERTLDLDASPQMIVRFGHGPAGPWTPRRDLEDVMVGRGPDPTVLGPAR